MGGIFEPFLDHHAKESQPPSVVLPSEFLAGRTEQGTRINLPLIVEPTMPELLPSDEQLQMMIDHKQTTLTVKQQRSLTSYVLEQIQQNKTVDGQELLRLADQKTAELAALANIILRSSKIGAPIALELYRGAMDAGDDRGAFSYANMIYRGYRGTPKNEELGIKLMSQLAQKGHPYAQMNLAAILMRTRSDQVEAALKLYQLAAKAGLHNAYAELGRMYRLGYGVHQDHAKAIHYFEQGSRAGNAQCNFMLGVYYSSGLGTQEKEPDQTKAFKYFQKAAMKGMPEAQYNVGLRFLKGHGVEPNSFNAAEFFRMAALQGFQLAQANLAGMYAEGRGVKKDLDEARQWLSKAAASGGAIGKDAEKRLAELNKDNSASKSPCVIM
ncbi:uncharacterized protein BYT42DRAFT_596179 [Radiomyces spectabilis]|uniref:uncharacterized protein n=1 Tax=Radiomyces spectabilis TaxID=64574 RepID=UPI00222081C1|nr:uncharacterized protein BYT42DRAFT_596179 [Radiomyces spectabilis]KAI8364754.1 hypothetical protein BYT42DRAFT_596179 [Radiomyces spectabilis]